MSAYLKLPCSIDFFNDILLGLFDIDCRPLWLQPLLAVLDCVFVRTHHLAKVTLMLS